MYGSHTTVFFKLLIYNKNVPAVKLKEDADEVEEL